MSNTLEDLFEQILHSEQKVQEQKSLLNEVKTNIHKYLEKIEEKEEELQCLQGEVVLKVQKLDDEELDLKWMQHRTKTLTEQKQQLQKETEFLQAELDLLINSNTAMMNSFKKELDNFVEIYDLQALTANGDNGQVKQEIAKLEIEETELKQELSSFHSHQRSMENLKQEKARLLRKQSDLKKKLATVNKTLTTEQLTSANLMKEKEHVKSLPHTDPEFRRLHEELDAAKDDTLEGICTALQEELQRLQQLEWQQQLQQQKTLQQQQHRKRQVQSASESQPPVSGKRFNFSFKSNYGKKQQVPDGPSSSSSNTVPSLPSKPNSGKPNLGRLTQGMSNIQNNTQLNASQIGAYNTSSQSDSTMYEAKANFDVSFSENETSSTSNGYPSAAGNKSGRFPIPKRKTRLM